MICLSIREFTGLKYTYKATKYLNTTCKTQIRDIPITLLANDLFFKVASPKSPIFTEPVVPVMKMLSHLRSLCITGGVLVCKKYSPFKICLHQFFKTFKFIFFNLLMYLKHRIINKYDFHKF